MSHFIKGLECQQTMLLPEHLDDYVDEYSPVRAIDAFAEVLDLAVLGFDTQTRRRWLAWLSSWADAADLSVRIFEPVSVFVTVGA